MKQPLRSLADVPIAARVEPAAETHAPPVPVAPKPSPPARVTVNARVLADVVTRMHRAAFELHIEKQDLVTAALDVWLRERGF